VQSRVENNQRGGINPNNGVNTSNNEPGRAQETSSTPVGNYVVVSLNFILIFFITKLPFFGKFKLDNVFNPCHFTG
jgi:hypothetical protein